MFTTLEPPEHVGFLTKDKGVFPFGNKQFSQWKLLSILVWESLYVNNLKYI